jgi:hypothetical protein
LGKFGEKVSTMEGKDENAYSVSFTVPGERVEEIRKKLEALGVKNITLTRIEDQDAEAYPVVSGSSICSGCAELEG